MAKRSDRALLVIDMVHDFVYGEGPQRVTGAEPALRYISGELKYFRERDRPVVFANTWRPGRDNSVIRDLTPRSHEPVLTKLSASAFFDTDLAAILAEGAVKRLTLVGVGASSSILLTAGDAMARGLRVVVPEPCVADQNVEDQRFALHLINEVWPRVGLGVVDMDSTHPGVQSSPSEPPTRSDAPRSVDRE